MSVTWWLRGSVHRRGCGSFLLLFATLCPAQQAAGTVPYEQHLRDALAATSQGNLSTAMVEIQAAIALDPKDASGWYQLGSTLGQTGDFAGAGSAFRHAILLQPSLAKAHYGLALTLIGNPLEKEDWPGAVAECREALRLQPDYPEALNLMGVGLTKQTQYAAAIEALQRATVLSPGFPEAHLNLGLALEGNDRLESAAAEYRAALQAKESYPEANSALGKLLFRLGKPEEAEPELAKALHGNPDLTDAHYVRARILQALHRKQDAGVEFAIAEELTQRPADGIQSSQMSNRGLELAAKGDMAGAATTLLDAIALKPDYGVPHFNLGLVLADRGELGASTQELSKAISLLPGQAAPWFELGRVLRLERDDQDALNALNWASHLAPSNTAIQAELRRMEASEPLLSPSTVKLRVGATADTAGAHVQYAMELSMGKDFAGAIGELLRALTVQPANQEARRNLAGAYEDSGQQDRSILEYRKLLVAFPDDTAGHIALGKILLAQGKGSEAAEEFKQALHYQPDSMEAGAALKQADALVQKQRSFPQ